VHTRVRARAGSGERRNRAESEPFSYVKAGNTYFCKHPIF
jgi:hypothetical protein